jgi:hypothetical protein
VACHMKGSSIKALLQRFMEYYQAHLMVMCIKVIQIVSKLAMKNIHPYAKMI